MRRNLQLVLGLLCVLAGATASYADSLSIEAWSTGNSLSATNLNSRHTTIQTWANGNIDNGNIKSSAGIVGSKLDLTSGTGRISQSTSVTTDAPVFTSGQTWDNAAGVFSLFRGTVTNTNSASDSRLIDLRVGSTIIASISRVGQLFLNSQDYASGPRTLLDGAWFNVASATYTDNVTAASGTAPRFVAYAFQRPAVAAANSSVTTTHAATVFIASAPVTSTNMTLTNRYALWVDQGDVRVGGSVYASGSATIDGRLDVTGTLWAKGNAVVGGTANIAGVATLTSQPILSSLTASRLVLTDASKGLVSNGALTTNYLVKSASSGASLAASVIYDDGTNVAIGTTGPENILHLAKSTAGGIGGSLYLDNNAVPALLNETQIAFGNDIGASFAGVVGTRLRSITRNIANGAASFQIDTWDGSVQATRLYINETGNVGIGTTSPGGSGTEGTRVLSLANGTAPVGGVANQVSLYSADVSASAELFAMDEAGNTPQLTPHPADFLNTLPLTDRPYPWAYSASNAYLGKKIQVDMAGLVAEVERLSGKRFAFVSDTPKMSWATHQASRKMVREAEIASAMRRRADLETQIAVEQNEERKAALTKERDAVVVPPAYTEKAPPQWMVDRGVQ